MEMRGAGPSTKAMEIENIRKEAEVFWREKTEEEYHEKAGIRKGEGLPGVYERYKWLFSRKLIMDLRRKEGQTDVDPYERRGIKKILSFLISERENLKRIPYELRINNLGLEKNIKIDGELIPLRSSLVYIANEGNRKKRIEIERRRLEFIESINPLLMRMWEVSWESCMEIGFNSYIQTWESLKEKNFPQLRKAASRILKETEDLYRDILQWVAKRKLGIKDIEKHDVLYFFRMREFDKYFPPERLREVMERSARDSGWNLWESPGLYIDIEGKTGKVTRASCFPVSVPDRVYIMIYPFGGQEDYQSLFHELGHALIYITKKGDQPFEKRYLVEPFFSESIAFIFHYLPLKRGWLKRHLDFSSPENYLFYGYFQKLYMVRRYCAKFQFESTIHEKMDYEDMRGLYRDFLFKGTYINHPEGFFLYDMDPFIMSAEYLTGWIVASQIEARLKDKFDDDWYRNPRASSFIKEILEGDEEDASRLLELKPYEPDTLINDFNENLR